MAKKSSRVGLLVADDVWSQLTPELLEESNCRSKNDFVNEAIKLKLQYDKTQGSQSFLSEEVLSAIDGKLSLFEKNMNASYYQFAMAVMMLIHIFVKLNKLTPEDIAGIRTAADADVKGLNGYVSIENLIDHYMR